MSRVIIFNSAGREKDMLCSWEGTSSQVNDTFGHD